MSANNYKLKFTAQAKEDLDNIYNYIAYSLYAENTAEKAIDKIEKALTRLKTMPYSAPIFDEPEYRDFNIRKLVINPYIAYFLINEEKKQVEIIHVLHALMDNNKALKKD